MAVDGQRRSENGFTLIELMVVVMIIAVLLAIAIPTLLGARTRAQDRSLQANVHSALKAEKAQFADTQVYSTDAAQMKQVEPSLDFVATLPSRGPAMVLSGAGGVLCITGRSGSAAIFSVYDNAQSGATLFSHTDLSSACAQPADGTAGGW